MATATKSGSVSKSLKRLFVWQYLTIKAKVDGIDLHSLGRVQQYLDDKFRIRRSYSNRPLQKPNSFFPGLRSIPVYDSSEFDWIPAIERNYEQLKGEFLQLREKGLLAPHPQNITDAGSWNTYYLFSNGKKFHSNCAACPATVAAISLVPGAGAAGQSYFSVMTAGTHVTPHCGPANTKIRCHLGITVPNSSRIRVGESVINWVERGCIVFDDSFEHEVWNPDAERVVLIMDMWHPDLTESERWALTIIARFSGRHRNYRRDLLKRR